MNSYIVNSLLYIYLFIIVLIYPIKAILAGFLTLINEFIIKNIIKENRPNGLPYGMPSSHALCYSILTVLLIPDNIVLSIISTILLLITFISKVVNYEHSIKQYLAGIFFGLFIGTCIYNLCYI